MTRPSASASGGEGQPPPSGEGVALWLRRLVRVEADEVRAMGWAFAYFFFLLAGYFVIRPVREEMGVAGGSENLPFLFSGTFVATLIGVPIFGALVSRYPRRVLVPVVYHFFAANILVFWLLFSFGGEELRLHTSRAFFVWTSFFSLFVVSFFWSFVADLFSSEQAKRLFGFIAAGGTAGALCGSLITTLTVELVGTVNLLFIPLVFLELAILCATRLARSRPEPPSPQGAPEASAGATGGGVLDGVKLALRSPYLLGICAYLFFKTTSGTVLYLQQASIIESAMDDPDARTRLFAGMNFAVQALTLGTQVFLTSRIIARIGVGWTLGILPAIYLVGFGVLGLWNGLAVIVVLQVVQRATSYALSSPTRQILFTVVSREERYKSKNFIDTVVFRGGDATSAWIFSALARLGASLATISFAALPVCGLWLLVARSLGRGHQRLEREGQPGSAPGGSESA